MGKAPKDNKKKTNQLDEVAPPVLGGDSPETTVTPRMRPAPPPADDPPAKADPKVKSDRLAWLNGKIEAVGKEITKVDEQRKAAIVKREEVTKNAEKEVARLEGSLKMFIKAKAGFEVERDKLMEK